MSSRVKFFISLAILMLASYVLTPRFWEVGGESIKGWLAARILRDTGGFPVFALGPLYVVYLQVFSLFSYPVSVQLEYCITYVFCYTSLFLLLCTALPRIPALVLTVAWIPTLALLQPGALVFGMGFLALYFRGIRDARSDRGYLPPLLGVATLCHSAFIVFLIGHMIGVAVSRVRKKCLFRSVLRWRTELRPGVLVVNGLLILLVVATLFFPSRRWDHNYQLTDSTYIPISLGNPLNVAFFQIGNWKHTMRTKPVAAWPDQDWYMTNAVAFGGARTIPEAFMRSPNTVFKNILENLRMAVALPNLFWIGQERGLLALNVVFGILLIGGGLGLLRFVLSSGNMPHFFALVVGSFGLGAALLLTWPIFRYVAPLLPIVLLCIAHSGPSLYRFITSVRSRKLGVFFLLVGITLNEWVLTTPYQQDSKHNI